MSLIIALIAFLTPTHLDTTPPPICKSQEVSLFSAVNKFSLKTSIVPLVVPTKILSDVTVIPIGWLNLTELALRAPEASIFAPLFLTPLPALANIVYVVFVSSRTFCMTCLLCEAMYKILSSSGETSIPITSANCVSKFPRFTLV